MKVSLNRIYKWMHYPYPFPTNYKTKILISFGIGFFVTSFLFIFKPFDFYLLLKKEFIYFTFLYGLITCGTIMFSFFILPRVFPLFFNPYKWNIYKMIIFVLVIISSIGIVNWVFSDFSSFNHKTSNYGFVFFQGTAFLVGIFPLLIYIYFTEQLIFQKNKLIAENISLVQKQNFIENNNIRYHKNRIVLKGDNKKEEFIIFLNDLFYINSDKNYASIFYVNNGVLKETLLRTSLNKIENQLSDFTCIVRCHKSFIVNTNNVVEIQGNARGHLLKMVNFNLLIPVSRSFPKELLFTLVNNT